MGTNVEETQTGEYWIRSQLISSASAGGCTGCGAGCIVDTDYKVSHFYMDPGTFTVTSVGNPAGGPNSVDYLVVAGGAGGGRNFSEVAVVEPEVIENQSGTNSGSLYCFKSFRCLQ